MKILSLCLAVAVLPGSAVAQMSVNDAMARLRERQGVATRPSTNPAATRPATQTASLDVLAAKISNDANKFLELSFDNLSTVLADAKRAERRDQVARLENSIEGVVTTCTITVIDVQQDRDGRYWVQGYFALPVPDDVERKARNAIHDANDHYDAIVRQARIDARTPASGTVQLSRTITGNNPQARISQAEKDRQAALKQLRDDREAIVPKAHVWLLGDQRLVVWVPGQKRRVAEAKVYRAEVGMWQPEPDTGGTIPWNAVGSMNITAIIQHLDAAPPRP